MTFLNKISPYPAQHMKSSGWPKALAPQMQSGWGRFFTRTMARSAASMLVLAGLLCGQAKAAGQDEMAEELGSSAVASQTVAQGPSAGLFNNLGDFSPTINKRGFATIGSGCYEIAEAVGHIFMGNYGSLKTIENAVQNPTLFNVPTAFWNGATALWHGSAALQKATTGACHVMEGLGQLAYDNPKAATVATSMAATGLKMAGVTPELILSMVQNNDFYKALSGGGALPETLKGLVSDMTTTEFWQQTAQHALGHSAPTGNIYEKAVEKMGVLPGLLSKSFNGAATLAMQAAVNAVNHPETNIAKAFFSTDAIQRFIANSVLEQTMGLKGLSSILLKSAARPKKTKGFAK